MPALTAGQLTNLRTTRHATKLYLAVYQPASIWTGRVNGNPAARATSIEFDGGAGTTPATHYEIWFGTSAGAKDVGVTRIKTHPGGASGTLTIPPNNFDIADNDYITVKANIQPQAIQPNCGTTIYEDWDTAYTNQNTLYHPLARMGSPACAFIDASTGLATLRFYSSSAMVAATGALASYAWTLPGGTYTVGNATTAGTSGAPNVVTWDTAGQYWGSLQVTDTNGKTHITYRPIFIFDDATAPYTQVEINGLEGSLDGNGWTATLTVRGTADASIFPDLAQVVLFARDYYGDTETSIGGDYTWRENIVFVGFVRAGSVKAHAWNQTVEFQAAGIGVLAENLPGFAFNLANGTPGGWHTLSGMTYALAAYHIITEHSTLDHIADVDLTPVSYSAEKIDFVASSLRDQIAQQCIAPVRSVFGSSRLGRIYARQNPQLVAAASRTEDVVLDTANTDFRDTVDIVQERTVKEVAQLDFNGFNFTGAGEQTPVLSLAPGVAYSTGRFERVDGMRVTDQSDSNIVSGYFEGRANNQYPDVACKWRGNYRVFDVFPQEKIRLNLTTAQNNRGIAWTNQVFWTKRVSFSFRNGVLLVDTNVEKDVVGSPGITGNYPSVPPTVDPVIEPPVIIDPPPVTPPPPRPGGLGELLYVCGTNAGGAGTGGIAKCVGAYSGSPVWSVVAGGGASINGLAGAAQDVDFINFDPFSYNGAQFTKMWAMTGDGLYLGVNLDGTPAFSKKLDSTAATALLGVNATLLKSFTPNVRIANEVLCLARGDFGVTAGRYRIYTLRSVDNGANWTANASYYILSVKQDYHQIIASYHTTGVYWITGSAYGTQAETSEAVLYKATTLPQFVKHFGFNTTGVPFYGDYATLTFPFINGSGVVYVDDNVAYMYGNSYSSGISALARFDTVETAATPAPTPAYVGDTRMSWGFSTPSPYYFYPSTFNANILVGARKDGGVAPSNQDEVWCSLNGGASWELRRPQTATRTNLQGPRWLYIALADENVFYIFGHDAGGNMYCNKTTDFGATFTGVDNFGTANAIDTVLGTSNYAGEVILLDYYKV